MNLTKALVLVIEAAGVTLLGVVLFFVIIGVSGLEFAIVGHIALIVYALVILRIVPEGCTTNDG